MSWTPLHVVLVVFCTRCCAQYVLTQETMISASLNERVTLSCHLNTGTIVDENYPYWFQQKPNQTAKCLIYNTNARPTEIPDRFSGSKSGNYAYLTISAAQAEDEATYSCLLWFSGVALFGGGTQLNIITGEVKPPSVFIYRASEEEMKTNKATTVCAVSDYTPNTVTVEWQVDGVKWTNGVHTSMVSKQRDNTYMQSSLLTMSSSEYTKHNDIACKVTHQGKDIVKTVKRSECV
ncbi:immunoglobulin lambda-like polypeptide 1 isoform X6 [Pseudophryne corroboree]|uniref:immunoglobulin lambda-like polypeptide 1 isoform X6 n=1 Tax=Pseudophryne corroboree TaxID=495146 RepID=UPI003081BA06